MPEEISARVFTRYKWVRNKYRGCSMATAMFYYRIVVMPACTLLPRAPEYKMSGIDYEGVKAVGLPTL